MNLKNTKKGKGALLVALSFLLTVAVSFGVSSWKPVRAYAAEGDAAIKTATVTGVEYGVGGQNLLRFTLSGTDYPSVNGGDSSTYNYTIPYSRLSALSFFDKISVNGQLLSDIYSGVDGNSVSYYINLFQVGGTFSLHLPSLRSTDDVNEIILEKGCEFPAYSEANGCFTIADKTTFTKENGMWKATIDVEYIYENTAVTTMTFGEVGLNYLIITLDGHDYPPNGGDAANHNRKVTETQLSSLNFFDKLKIDGKTLREVYAENSRVTTRDYVLNFFQRSGAFAFPLPGYTASTPIGEIVVEQGCEFPSYGYLINGEAAKCFVTTESIIAVKGGDVGFTVLKACDDSKPAILDDSVVATLVDGGYTFDVRFNRDGVDPTDDNVEDEIDELIQINGVTLAEINSTQKFATAKWLRTGARYYLRIFLSSQYTGEGAIINEDDYFVGNTIRVDENLVLPSGSSLGQSFLLHMYRTNNITEILDENLVEDDVYVEKVTCGYDVNGDFNIWIYFSQEITAGLKLFLASSDSFGKSQLKPMNGPSLMYYDDYLAANFISGGYKSALLDKVVINGCTIGEWLAYDSTPGYLTAVMVHYGQVGQKVMSIVCDLSDDGSWATDAFKSASQAYENGGLTVEVKEGMRFPTGKRCSESVTYVCNDGSWKVRDSEFGVYYAGAKVENGQSLSSAFRADKNNVCVVGDDVYEIKEQKSQSGLSARYSVYDSENVKVFEFTVMGSEIVSVPSGGSSGGGSETVGGGDSGGGDVVVNVGCFSSLESGTFALTILALGCGLIAFWRKRDA